MPATRSRSTSRGRSPAKKAAPKKSPAKSPSSSRSKSKTPTKKAAKSPSKTPTKKAAKSPATKNAAPRAEYKPKSPPILNCTPDGYTPTPLISNMILCPGNLDYFFADLIVPSSSLLFRVYLVACALYTDRNYALATSLLFVQQILDCADGQCARRYGLGSEFGAWLDHITDEIFGYMYAGTFIYMIGTHNGWYSVPLYIICVVLAIMGLGGKSTFEAKDTYIKFKDYKWNHVLGMYQEFYMSYIYIVIMGLFTLKGWLPDP